MSNWLWFVIIFGAYILLTQWLLPKLGVRT